MGIERRGSILAPPLAGSFVLLTYLSLFLFLMDGDFRRTPARLGGGGEAGEAGGEVSSGWEAAGRAEGTASGRAAFTLLVHSWLWSGPQGRDHRRLVLGAHLES